MFFEEYGCIHYFSAGKSPNSLHFIVNLIFDFFYKLRIIMECVNKSTLLSEMDHCNLSYLEYTDIAILSCFQKYFSVLWLLWEIFFIFSCVYDFHYIT